MRSAPGSASRGRTCVDAQLWYRGKTYLAAGGERETSPDEIVRRIIELPEEGLCLKGGGFYLGFSQEQVGSEHFVPVLHAKSGTARAGLFVHVTANLIDIGSIGNLTFQLAPVLDVIVRPGMALAQVSFWKPIGEIDLYQGKYAGSVGPRASESYRDWAGRDGLPPEGT
ncbi:MAG: dCTP deaminase [Pseudonocardiaceae bacterium]